MYLSNAGEPSPDGNMSNTIRREEFTNLIKL